MELRKVWQAKKFQSEEAFKKAHAGELLNAHTQGTTGFPVKFELGLGPALDNYEGARQKKKDGDATKYLGKSKEIVAKYKKRIEDHRNELGTAYQPLHDGIAHLEQHLK